MPNVDCALCEKLLEFMERYENRIILHLLQGSGVHDPVFDSIFKSWRSAKTFYYFSKKKQVTT